MVTDTDVPDTEGISLSPAIDVRLFEIRCKLRPLELLVLSSLCLGRASIFLFCEVSVFFFLPLHTVICNFILLYNILTK